MKIRLTAIIMVLAAALAALNSVSCGKDEHDRFKDVVSAVLIISHLDTDRDGVPDTYQYRIQASADAESSALGSAPSVRLPDGTSLTTTCVTSADLTVCETAAQTPAAPGAKANIPAGVYSIRRSALSILEFEVTATALAVPDIAGVDLATLAPPPLPAPATLADPAVLAWVATAGTAGGRWDFTVTNVDGADDNGQFASGTTPWATPNFSLDLPNTWDSADALLVEINAVGVVSHHEYVEVDQVQSIITGYTRL
jgi:hypothetical protein